MLGTQGIIAYSYLPSSPLGVYIYMALVNNFINFLDGVIGVMVHPSTFIEESNFYISEVVLKVKIRNSEAGWVVRVSEVTGEEAQ